MDILDRIIIRKATIADLDAVTALEAECFPAAEAASRDSFAWRLEAYPQHFIVVELDGRIISFVNGPVTVEADLVDEMYSDASYCNDSGEWQMIFGIATRTDLQCRGIASYLMRIFIEEARSQGRKGVVLTCKEHKINFYSSFVYIDEGVCGSMHGGVPWHQMRIIFE